MKKTLLSYTIFFVLNSFSQNVFAEATSKLQEFLKSVPYQNLFSCHGRFENVASNSKVQNSQKSQFNFSFRVTLDSDYMTFFELKAANSLAKKYLRYLLLPASKAKPMLSTSVTDSTVFIDPIYFAPMERVNNPPEFYKSKFRRVSRFQSLDFSIRGRFCAVQSMTFDFVDSVNSVSLVIEGRDYFDQDSVDKGTYRYRALDSRLSDYSGYKIEARCFAGQVNPNVSNISEISDLVFSDSDFQACIVNE